MGDSTNNILHIFHVQPQTGLFEVRVRRHFGSAKINSMSPKANLESWRAIVASARSSSTDEQFTAVVVSVWPRWAGIHIVGANLQTQYRAAVLSLVDP